MDIKPLISKAHAEFRRLRSGELGDVLRKQGIDYRIIWGLESYKLREVAISMMNAIAQSGLPPTECQTELARALWAEDVRESKMLATRLFPPQVMLQQEAQQWAESILYTELADQACMYLFARLDFAPQIAKQWIKSEKSMMQYMALMIALRLEVSLPEAEYLVNDMTKPLWLRTTAAKAVTLLTSNVTKQ